MSVQYGTHVRAILLITVIGGNYRMGPVELPYLWLDVDTNCAGLS